MATGRPLLPRMHSISHCVSCGQTRPVTAGRALSLSRQWAASGRLPWESSSIKRGMLTHHRATGDALGVLAQEAALGFEQGHLLGQAEVDLVEVGVADQRVLLRHLLAVDLEALFGGEFGGHGNALRMS